MTGLVTIDEDPAVRLATFVVDCTPNRLRIDIPTHVVFRPLRFAGGAGEVTTPLFAPS